MALPAALVPLGRVAGKAFTSATPMVKAKALEYYKRATDGRVSTADAAVALASNSKNGLATVATGLVASGFNPNRIFTNEVLAGIRDQEIQALAQNLRSEFQKVYGQIDGASTFNDVNHDPSEAGARQLAAETVSFIRRRLLNSSNDDRATRELHVRLRLFVGMSEDMLGEAMKLKASNA